MITVPAEATGTGGGCFFVRVAARAIFTAGTESYIVFLAAVELSVAATYLLPTFAQCLLLGP
jgi:hypothetical protein